MESWCNSVFHSIHDWCLSHGVTENLQSRTLTHHGNLNKKWKIIKFHCFINMQWHRLKTKCCIDQRRGISISQCIMAVIVSNISTWSDAMKQKWICYVLKSLNLYRSLDVSIARVVKERGGGMCPLPGKNESSIPWVQCQWKTPSFCLSDFVSRPCAPPPLGKNILELSQILGLR